MARPRALTSIQIELIRGSYKDGGKSPAELAVLYGVSSRTIQRIVKDIKPEPQYMTRSMSDARFEELCSMRRRAWARDRKDRKPVPLTPFEQICRNHGMNINGLPWEALLTVPDKARDGTDHGPAYYFMVCVQAKRWGKHIDQSIHAIPLDDEALDQAGAGGGCYITRSTAGDTKHGHTSRYISPRLSTEADPGE